MLTVITSFSPDGWQHYGWKFVDTFKAYWPSNVKLVCAWEGTPPNSSLNGFDLLSTEPCKAFLERHSESLIVRGQVESPLSPWGGKARRIGHSFRHNAYKFSRKVFAVCAAARYIEGGRLFWVDADVETNKQIPDDFLADILPKSISLCYLSRQQFKYPSELGFVGYNLALKETRKFLTAYEDRYAGDYFMKDAAWDDCSQFDRLVEKRKPSVRTIYHQSQQDPFGRSILGKYMTHNKGGRKCV